MVQLQDRTEGAPGAHWWASRSHSKGLQLLRMGVFRVVSRGDVDRVPMTSLGFSGAT